MFIILHNYTSLYDMNILLWYVIKARIKLRKPVCFRTNIKCRIYFIQRNFLHSIDHAVQKIRSVPSTHHNILCRRNTNKHAHYALFWDKALDFIFIYYSGGRKYLYNTRSTYPILIYSFFQIKKISKRRFLYQRQ